MWRCFPCPHSDCMLSQTWYQDLKSHCRVAYGQVLCDNEAKSGQKRRQQEGYATKSFSSVKQNSELFTHRRPCAGSFKYPRTNATCRVLIAY